jgi:tRNA (cmo5U34)-methyltransferase
MAEDSMDEIRARFDRAAAQWDANPVRVALARAIAGAIEQRVPLRPDMTALDFGAGTGLLTLALLPRVSRLTAVDASLEMLRVLDGKLRELGIGNVRTLQADIAAGPLDLPPVDLIASSMVLHHLRDVPAVLKGLRAHLRPGGWIALADLDAEDGSFHDDPTGVFHRGFERKTVCRWLDEAGYSEPAAQEAHRIVKPRPGGGTREYSVFLATARAS